MGTASQSLADRLKDISLGLYTGRYAAITAGQKIDSIAEEIRRAPTSEIAPPFYCDSDTIGQGRCVEQCKACADTAPLSAVAGNTPRTDAHLSHLNLPDGRKVGIPNETVELLRQLERELEHEKLRVKSAIDVRDVLFDELKAIRSSEQGLSDADKLLRDGEPIGFRTMTIQARIEEALQRIRDGRAYMRIPADQTDPDIVLADCLTLLKRAVPSATRVKYERRPELDKRIAHGDDYAGDAWVRWVVPGHTPEDAA